MGHFCLMDGLRIETDHCARFLQVHEPCALSIRRCTFRAPTEIYFADCRLFLQIKFG
jgi:hypothetical protein